MSRIKTILLLLVVALLGLSEQAFASHPFHVTRAEIDYNAKRQTFEVALCVWPEDLERAVSKMERRSVKIDYVSETKRDEIFSRYIARSFQFVAKTNSPADETDENGKPVAAKIRWIGSELEVKQGWLYFEVDAKNANRWSIENRMFFELNEEQLNQVQIRSGKTLESQTLSALQTSVEWARK